MKLYSTNNKKNTADLKDAVLKGLCFDGGLFMPSKIPKIPANFIKNINKYNFQQIAFEVARTLLEKTIPINELKKIVNESINFDTPLIKLAENIYTLELFHGPTLAFKDFGARFMSRLMVHLIKKSKQKLLILAATSGDTGSAVGNAFLNLKNTKVILLYPSGKVSKIQEQQLTTMGRNISALEIKGTFDDCQRLVKEAFTNKELKEKFAKNKTLLSSANSINIARLIPQTFYYFHAYAQYRKLIKDAKKLVKCKIIFSVPSGNFGNLTAGLIAKKMGLPIKKFIAATNANDIFPKYLSSGKFNPKPSKKTISNAMDVGNPSNFARIKALYKNNIKTMSKDIWSKSFDDKKTKDAILEIYKKYNYISDPHGAVGYLGLKNYLKKDRHRDTIGIFLETAHSAKFLNIVEPILKKKIKIPAKLVRCLNKKKTTTKLSKNFKDLKNTLLRE